MTLNTELNEGDGKLNPNQIVRFEVFTSVSMKNSVYWDIKPS
jgi:hypothetical protein